MVRSGFRRYPGQLARSLGEPTERCPPDASSAPAELFHSPKPVAAMWLGHATVLFRIGDHWILTDPVFADRVGPRLAGRTLGVARQAPPPIGCANLPPIDLILISHAHFDHLDLPSLRSLTSPRTTVVTAAKTADLIPRGFAGVVELEPSESHRYEGLNISAFEPDHWGSRFAVDRWRGCNAYLLESDEGRFFFAGDTADTRGFDRVGRVDMSVFGIGAYDPWEHAHATPEQVWRMASDMGSDRLMPIHHSTFDLSDEPKGEPIERLMNAAGVGSSAIVAPGPGDLWTPCSGIQTVDEVDDHTAVLTKRD